MAFKRHISILFGLALLLLVGCNRGFILKLGDQDIFAFGSVDSCNFVQNELGARISWKSSVPAHFIITSTVPADYDQSIINAANKWNNAKRMTVIEVHRDNGYPTTAGTDRTNGIYWMQSWDGSSTKEQGRTIIKWDISKIKDADIKINAKDFRFFKESESDKAGKISLESLMLHEFGHALGLKHIDDKSSSMQPYLAAGVSRISTGDIDINSLNCEY